MYNNPPKTLFVGQRQVFLTQCHSTNDEAAALLLADAATPEGTVVATARQTHGRGQRGNYWHAEPGLNLTFSLILKPGFLPPDRQFHLNMAVSLAIHEFLSGHLPHPGPCIKWPNDVYFGERKLGGVLIENTLQGRRLVHSVVGIGLNVNQVHFPEGLRATSMRLAAPSAVDGYDLGILLPELLHFIEIYYLKLRAGASLHEPYLRRLLGYGQARAFQAGGQVFEGVVAGLDEAGRLAIRHDGRLRYFALQEVAFHFDS